MPKIDAISFPLSAFFLSGYLSKKDDPTNFPGDRLLEIAGRYEMLFTKAVTTLGLSKEQLKSRNEFNFDAGNASNFEGGIAILRVIEALHLRGFDEIALVSPRKGEQGADLTCLRNGIGVCIEVKAVTKQSRGREGFFLEEQLYEKLCEHAEKAGRQLAISANVLSCEAKLLACVVNWFAHSTYLGESDYQGIVNKLEKHGKLKNIDGVLFITQAGQDFLFLNKQGKRIDA